MKALKDWLKIILADVTRYNVWSQSSDRELQRQRCKIFQDNKCASKRDLKFTIQNNFGLNLGLQVRTCMALKCVLQNH
jgi:hypothetical protein